jgi:flavin-dependent dehydrogenase
MSTRTRPHGRFRPESRPTPLRRTFDADVVIAGASFAGLAAARALRGHDVVVVDPHPVGSFETSAGAVPIRVLAALSLTDSAREVHDRLIVHGRRGERVVALSAPFAVVDYALLCERLASQSGARMLQGRARAYRHGAVHTDTATLRCRAAIDASGHRAILASSLRPDYAQRNVDASGVEVVLPRPRHFPSGLHVYFDRDRPPGYGWAFTAAATIRVGVGVLSAARDARRLDDALRSLLAQAGLDDAQPPLARHGGRIPLRPRAATVGEVFVVGDAAGQVLPLTAEGIRPALHFGTRLGSWLAEALDGRIAIEEARRRYARDVAMHRAAYRRLAFAQSVLIAAPPAASERWMLALAGSSLSTPAMARYSRAFDAAPLPGRADTAPMHAASVEAP